MKGGAALLTAGRGPSHQVLLGSGPVSQEPTPSSPQHCSLVALLCKTQSPTIVLATSLTPTPLPGDPAPCVLGCGPATVGIPELEDPHWAHCLGSLSWVPVYQLPWGCPRAGNWGEVGEGGGVSTAGPQPGPTGPLDGKVWPRVFLAKDNLTFCSGHTSRGLGRGQISGVPSTLLVVAPGMLAREERQVGRWGSPLTKAGAVGGQVHAGRWKQHSSRGGVEMPILYNVSCLDIFSKLHYSCCF